MLIMTKFILGQKIEMSQIFDKDGTVRPVTIVRAGPTRVTQVKTKEKDGYDAVQIGFGIKKAKNIARPIRGHLKKSGGEDIRWLREFRDDGKPELGTTVDVSAFKEGEVVTVSGTTKGKGFQGVVKRHGFKGGPRTHGQKHSEREPGSIGATWPQRVIKGMRMAGRMGGNRVTVKNLEIIKVDKERNLLAVSGAVPGARGSLIEVRGM